MFLATGNFERGGDVAVAVGAELLEPWLVQFAGRTPYSRHRTNYTMRIRFRNCNAPEGLAEIEGFVF